MKPYRFGLSATIAVALGSLAIIGGSHAGPPVGINMTLPVSETAVADVDGGGVGVICSQPAANCIDAVSFACPFMVR